MSEVAKLEQTIESMKRDIAVKDMVEKLESNREFKKLIIEGFCTKEAATYVQLSADPNLGDRERADALGLAQASGHLKRYLEVLKTMGRQAQSRLSSYEEELVVMRNEEFEHNESDEG